RDVDELATLLSQESGKPIRDARAEVTRGALTFRTAAEEALRINGEWLPLDWSAANRGRHGIVRRYAIGPVAGISPFNFPLNLAAHKVAPAIAAGCSIVLKPPSKDPLIMLRIARYIDETDLPKGAVSILPMDRPTGDRMVSDDRFKLLSFTGSPSIGWKMKAEAGKKKVVLELGGNAGAIVDATADLDWAVDRLVYGAFAYAGQVCISVQRIYVVREIYAEFERRFVERVGRVRVGDPLDPETDLGPMLDEAAVERTEAWVSEAIAGGARALVRGEPKGRWFGPTVLADVPRDAAICAEEAFAPVVNLFPVDSFADALREINDSRFGLQCGVFTSSLEHALAAHDELEVGGIIVNDAPTWRTDPMPYGGVKDSGLGREGLRSSIEDMTEPRLLVFARGS
ncbi:MAG: aldehyde dehydrogenase family protein, partial [Candidatus Limnocylindria bacterium]